MATLAELRETVQNLRTQLQRAEAELQLETVRDTREYHNSLVGRYFRVNQTGGTHYYHFYINSDGKIWYKRIWISRNETGLTVEALADTVRFQYSEEITEEFYEYLLKTLRFSQEKLQKLTSNEIPPKSTLSINFD